MNPLALTGLGVGALAFADKFRIADDRPAPGPAPSHGVHDTEQWYTQLLAWAKGEWSSYNGLTGTSAFWGEDLRQGLAVWGPVSTDDTVPAWSLLACKHVLDRWATIGERAQVVSANPFGGADPSGTPARIQGPLDKLRHLRNQVAQTPYDTLFNEPVCVDTERKCRTLASVIEGEGDFYTTDPHYGDSYGDYFVDELEERVADVGKGLGWAGGKLAGLAADLGLGALRGVFESPVGALALIGGAYLIYRKVT